VPGVPPADDFAHGFANIEGPVWLGDALYVSHFALGTPTPASRILKVVPGQSVSVFISDAGSNGLAVTKSGDLVAARHSDGTVSRLSLSDPTVATPLAATYDGARFDSPNDLAIRSDGNIYFTDPDWQSLATRPQPKTRVYRIAPGGAVSVIDEDLEEPNGITLSPDERVLYVASLSALQRYDVLPDGSVTGKRTFGAGPAGGDGMAVDCAGNLYVALPDGVAVLDPAGSEIGRIPVEGPQLTNVAFGGPEHKTLFITHLGDVPGLYTAELDVPGMPY
jgi:gluconolactonase